MPPIELLTPILSFLGAVLGAYLVYRTGRQQDWSRRFQSALDMLVADDARQRALGRARIVELCKNGANSAGRGEALAMLREDVWTSCPPDVREALEQPLDHPLVRIAKDDTCRLNQDQIFVSFAVVESARAYVEVAGGADAAPDQGIARASEAVAGPTTPQAAAALVAPGQAALSAADPLPADQRLILVKLTSDAAALKPEALRERARKAWRLSIERVQSEPPEGVVAVAQQRVIGAWTFEGVKRSTETPDRVEFELGSSIPGLIGREYRDTSQNPIRYWP